MGETDQDSTRVDRLKQRLAGIVGGPSRIDWEETETVGDPDPPTSIFLSERWLEQIEYVSYKEKKYRLKDDDGKLVLEEDSNA